MTAPPSAAGTDLAAYLQEAAQHLSGALTPKAQAPRPKAQGPTPNARFPGSIIAVRERTLRAAPEAAELPGRPWSPQYWDPEVAAVLARLEGTAFPLEPLGRRDASGRDVGFLRYTTYGAVGARRFQPFGVRYLTPKNLAPSGIDLFRSSRWVAPGSRNDPPRSRLRPGDILLSNSGVASLGRPALFLCPGEFNISQHLNLIRVAGIDACYVTLYLHTGFARAQMRRLYSGTGAAGLSYDDIRSLRIPVLPASDQAAVRRAFLRMHAVHEEAMALKATGDDADRAGTSGVFQAKISRAHALLASFIEAVEAHILRPSDGALERIWLR